MSEVYIPFRYDMRKASIEHGKYCTTRSKRYADPGDTFQLDGHLFEVQAVQRRPIGHVASRLYRFEGFDSKESFVVVWNELHPYKQYREDSDVLYYVHWYQELDDKVPTLRCTSCGREIIPYDELTVYPWTAVGYDPRPCCSAACARSVA